MGSGSSSSKSNSPSVSKSSSTCNTMPLPSSRGACRGRQQFEEVEFQDPNLPQCAQEPSFRPNGYVPVRTGGLSMQSSSASCYNRYPPEETTCTSSCATYSQPQQHWQNAGQAVHVGIQQEIKQPRAPPQVLVPHPNQDPDELLSRAPQRQEQGDDDLIFETFHHNNGLFYTCIQQSGKRYYLDDWDTQEWQAFPSSWASKGYFLFDGEPIPDHGTLAMSSRSNDIAEIDSSPGLGGGVNDDRAGIFKHPTKGQLLTYIFEEKRNIHCYFDDSSGMWVKLPVSWEQHSDFVKPMIAQIQEAVPLWKDQYDIVAAVRQSNYDVDDVISTYFTIGDVEVGMDSSSCRNTTDNKLLDEKEKEISALQDKYINMQQSHRDVSHQNKQLLAEFNKMKTKLEQLREQASSLEVEAKLASLKLAAMQQERPRTGRRMASTAQTETAEPATDPDAFFDDSPKHASSPPQAATVVQPQVPTIDADLLISMDMAAKELDKSKLTLKKVVKQGFQDMKELFQTAMAGLSKMKNIDSKSSEELQDLKVLYKKECLQRKLLYNQLQELRGNIRVFCRVRYDSHTRCCLEFSKDQEICATNPAGRNMVYRFDKVFAPCSTQTEVFELALPIIASCVDGYNICIMAYGQTGSGKTYTMMGPKDNPGVNIRSIHELLKICKEREQVSYTLKVSMLEVYNESLQDLLCGDGYKKKLDIKMQGKRLLVQGLTEIEVCKEADITRVMEMGDANRTVAATKMNSSSSRSHLLLILSVDGVDRVSKATSHGSLMLVDLAGSERIAKSGAKGQTLVEAAAINKSLTSLGQVFHGLRTSALHIPYRNSKLTHLLQQALGGDAKVCLFVNVSPDINNISETLSTLQFGANAIQVALGQATRNVSRSAKK